MLIDENKLRLLNKTWIENMRSLLQIIFLSLALRHNIIYIYTYIQYRTILIYTLQTTLLFGFDQKCPCFTSSTI